MGQQRKDKWHSRVFFGLHYDLHASAQDTQLGAELTYEHLRAELEKVQPDWVQCDCKGHPGYTSWPTEVGSTSPGVVKDSLRIHRDVTRDLGIPLVVHYSGVWDSRAVELHPEWARIGPDGKPGAGRMQSTCNLSGYTEELMIPQLLEILDKYDVDGFWVDGENWATLPCWCPRCKAEFTRRTGLAEIPLKPSDPHWEEWANFHRELFVEHVRKYAEAVHKRKPEGTVCSNWMYTAAQPEAVEAPVDYLSGDFAPAWGLPWAELEARFMESRGLSWDLMAWGFTKPSDWGHYTFKHPAHLCQEAACVIAVGGAISIYDQPQRTGRLTGWHQDVLAEVARFCRARQPWCQGTEPVHEAVVLHSSADFHARAGEHLMSTASGAHLAVQGAVQALLDNQVQVEVMNEFALTENLDAFKLVVLPETERLPAALMERLTDYVQKGGRLLCTGPRLLAELLELVQAEVAGEVRAGGTWLAVGEEAVTFSGEWRPCKSKGAASLSPFLTNQEPARHGSEFSAALLAETGTGKALYMPGELFRAYHEAAFPRLARFIKGLLQALTPAFQLEVEAPSWVHVAYRRQGERLVVHLVNLSAEPPATPRQNAVVSVPPAGPVRLKAKLQARPTKVYLAPSFEPVEFAWEEGQVSLELPAIGIMDSVVFEF